MQRGSPETTRIWAWLAAAMSAPLAHFSGGSWLALLTVAILCGGSLWLPQNRITIMSSKLLCLLELGWIIVLLSQYIPLCALYWPGEKSECVVPAILLALGAYGCRNRAERTAGVLFILLTILYIPVFAAGVKDIRTEWLMPTSMELSPWIIPILLLPKCVSISLGSTGKGKEWYSGILLFGLALWIFTAGVLSPAVADRSEVPFRELGRSLTLGAASRFEAIISLICTLGWFCLVSLLIRCAAAFARLLGTNEKWSVWMTAAISIALSWTEVRINEIIGAAVTAVLWVLLPMLCRKNFPKKREKTP